MPKEVNGHFGRAGVYRVTGSTGDADLYSPDAIREESSEPVPPAYCINHHSRPKRIAGPNSLQLPFLCNTCRKKWVVVEVPVDARHRKKLFILGINRNDVVGVVDPDGENKTLRSLRLVKGVTPKAFNPVKFLRREESKNINRLRDPSLPPI